RAPEVSNPLFTFSLQLGIVHECRFGIRRRFLFLLGDQVTGDVLRVFNAQTQAGHYRHVLNLQFMAIVRALTVLQIELIGKPLLRVILRANIFLLIWTIRACALARIMNPAYKIIVIRLLANTSEIRSECAALHLSAFSDRVAVQTAAGLHKFFLMLCILGFLLWRRLFLS